MNYYNEHDPKAAAWLRELIRAGEIPEGKVDERSICDVQPDNLRGFTQCHFFAGIGGWSYALKLAGWPADQPVWTGSCPCQPFSTAGKQLGTADERHLWPVFFRLIAECRPVVVFGEQVASAIGKGWLDGVSEDLEREGYTCGSVVLGAHSVGAPHIRQRLYWVANSNGQQIEPPDSGGFYTKPCSGGFACGMADTQIDGREQRRTQPNRGSVVGGGGTCGVGNSVVAGLEGYTRHEHDGNKSQRITANQVGSAPKAGGSSHWDSFDILRCTDGKARRIEPGTFPLAHGIPGRVGLLRGYGNAIVPQIAAEFIKAFQEIT